MLTDFSPSTRTIELEKLFDDFRDCGFAIRWVNDTTALAVFGTPSMGKNPHLYETNLCIIKCMVRFCETGNFLFIVYLVWLTGLNGLLIVINPHYSYN